MISNTVLVRGDAGITTGRLTRTRMKRVLLTKGKFALVDDEDFEKVSKFRWYAEKAKGKNKFYAAHKRDKKKYLHRFVMRDPKGKQIDHRNNDGLDCRKMNLRVATNQQNRMSSVKTKRNKKSSRYKGVTFDKRSGRFIAQIMKAGKHFHLGSSLNQKDCAKMYNKAALKLFGSFAKLNKL